MKYENKFHGITGGCNERRDFLVDYIINKTGLPAGAIEVVECSDEKSGQRFGNRKCRKGWAYKIGGGGRNKGSRYAYQVWAVVKTEWRSPIYADKIAL